MLLFRKQVMLSPGLMMGRMMRLIMLRLIWIGRRVQPLLVLLLVLPQVQLHLLLALLLAQPLVQRVLVHHRLPLLVQVVRLVQVQLFMRCNLILIYGP
jgi:hypothetical protein